MRTMSTKKPKITVRALLDSIGREVKLNFKVFYYKGGTDFAAKEYNFMSDSVDANFYNQYKSNKITAIYADEDTVCVDIIDISVH